MLKRTMIACALLALAGNAMAADVEAGKAKVKQICGECHDPGDWKGKSAAEIQGKIQDVLAGKHKHPKKLDLTPADIENIAAFWASASG